MCPGPSAYKPDALSTRPQLLKLQGPFAPFPFGFFQGWKKQATESQLLFPERKSKWATCFRLLYPRGRKREEKRGREKRAKCLTLMGCGPIYHALDSPLRPVHRRDHVLQQCLKVKAAVKDSRSERQVKLDFAPAGCVISHLLDHAGNDASASSLRPLSLRHSQPKLGHL